MSKSRQSIKCFKYFKQSALSESCKTDFSTDEFIQCMRDTQISFEAVQKDSNNSIMQIKEKWLHWLENILIHCSAWYHEQSFKVNYNQKTEWHNWDSSHAFECSNESEMQAIHDLNVRFTSRLSSHHMRLQD